MSTQRRSTKLVTLGALVLPLLLLVVYVIPILYWLAKSAKFQYAIPETRWLFGDLIWPTLRLAAVCSVLSVAIGYPAVLISVIGNPALRVIVGLSMLVPLVVGTIARNYSFLRLFSFLEGVSRRSATHGAPQVLLYTEPAVDFVMAIVLAPVAFFIITAGAQCIRPEQIDAARTLGLSDRRILTRVIVPMTFRSTLLSTALTFALALGFFVTPRMIGGGKTSTCCNAIVELVAIGQFSDASLLGLHLLILGIIVTCPFLVVAGRLRTIALGR